MILEKKVLVPINIRNIKTFIEKGYEVTLATKQLLVNVEDLNLGTKVKITAVCNFCKSHNIISYSKYLVNKNRNNKGYYSCFNCKSIEKEKTCISKYGVSSYSMTDTFKETESKKWKGTRKGNDKYLKTMIERYGVDCFFKTEDMKKANSKWMASDDFKIKSKQTIIEKWGVDHYSKTEEFKSKIEENKESIIEKIKKTAIKQWGVDTFFKTEEFRSKMIENKDLIIEKIKKTCMDRYGVDNVTKVKSVQDKIISKKIELGYILPDDLLSYWERYRRSTRNITKKFKKELYENWDGYDYYDNEFIKGYQSYSHIHRYYPTIDHKISIYYGFINNISPEEIGDISNLCITKRYINSIKRHLIESEFSLL